MFPSFNLYSTSLLLLTSQGLLFGFLLLRRFKKERKPSDLLLSIVLIITCYHQTVYTIGFMDWYDTYPTTKVNYYLVDLSLVLAPLIYYYIRSVVLPAFQLRNIRYWHFFPMLIYFFIKAFILIVDSYQPDFDEVQNGELVINYEWKFIDPIAFLFKTLQMLLYLAFSFQLLYAFREKIKHYFANTYKLELSWLQNFLIAYSFLYLFNSLQEVVNEVIVDLHWTQEWWYYLVSGFTIIYVGICGYFIRLAELQNVDFRTFETPKPNKRSINDTKDDTIENRRTLLETFMYNNKPYLDAELSLISLAGKMEISREELSDTINQGFNSRFNDFINKYRINETKRLIFEGKHKTHSLLGLAFEAGFNSKATFNRAFKKAENQSPSEYLKSLMISE